MPNEVIRTIYQCAFYQNTLVPCDPQRRPFQSVNIEEVGKHEAMHKALIATAEKRIQFRATGEEILAREICVGQWSDWKKLLELAVRLRYVMSRQSFMVSHSLMTFQHGIGLVREIKELIWHCTKEGILNTQEYQYYTEVYQVLEVFLSHVWWEAEAIEKTEIKNVRENLAELSQLILELRAELYKLNKLSGIDETEMEKIEKAVQCLDSSVDADMRRVFLSTPATASA